MRRIVLCISCSVVACCGVSQADMAMTWVTVGDPGNAADSTAYGAVAYAYRIGKYEVTNSQYCQFLTAVATSDMHDLYNTSMTSEIYGGIERSGSLGSYSYSVKAGRANNPVNYVGWYDTLRFANWLHNGQPVGEQNAFSTEDGAYDMALGSLTVRKPGARVWLSDENEWYKAAYYKGGSTDAGYWAYATQSDAYPTPEPPPGGENSANYGQRVGGHQITDVGAYFLSEGPYGTFDQNGNVWEWSETLVDPDRVIRGSSWKNGAWSTLPSSFRFDIDPSTEGDSVGFRIAGAYEPVPVPLPSAVLLGAIGLGVAGWRLKRWAL